MLETARLIIRPAVLKDAPLLYQLNSDPEVMRYTGDVNFKNMADAESLISTKLIPQFQKNGMGRFMVFLKDGTYIGWCGLKHFPEQNEVDLGYRFMKKFWGQGYATEASLACLEYGFKTLKLQKIIARAMPENVSSIKVMMKLGMTFRGFKKDPCDPIPFIFYDISQKEFLK